MMLCLHLFNRDYRGLFEPLIFIGSQPLSYYISLFSDACVSIFAFVSGYGLYLKFHQRKNSFFQDNIKRLRKLYINYWLIIFLFVIVLGYLLDKDGYPGSFLKLFGNISGLETSYNGAWWFFTIYVLFVLSSGFWFRLIDKSNPYFFFGLLLILYLIAFYLRIYKTQIFQNEILNFIHRNSALYFCTLFQFMLGAFALKYNWNAKAAIVFSVFRFKNLTAIFGILILMFAHGVVPNFIVAPFTGLGFILLYLRLDIIGFLTLILNFLKPHFTNIWLVHMFFYLIYFRDFVYGFKFVPLIFIILVSLSVISSVFINFIIEKINKLVINT